MYIYIYICVCLCIYIYIYIIFRNVALWIQLRLRPLKTKGAKQKFNPSTGDNSSTIVREKMKDVETQSVYRKEVETIFVFGHATFHSRT